MCVLNRLEKEDTETIVRGGPKNVGAKEIHVDGNDTQNAFCVCILNRSTV